MKNLFSYFTLFSSTGTLLCCALPALLVAIGAGGVMATIYANVPGFSWIGQNKDLLFISVALILAINGFLLWLKRNEPCPIDLGEIKAKACSQARKASIIFYLISIILYAIGFFFSYLAIYLID